MSLDDLWHDENLIPIMMVMFVVIMLVCVPIGIAISKSTNKQIYGEGDYEYTAPEQAFVKILTKEMAPHPLNQAVMINKVIFECEDGERIELAIKDPNVYGVMVAGDKGVLNYQGKKFISFKREM